MQAIDEDGIWRYRCVICGIAYELGDTYSDTKIKSRFRPDSSGPKIIPLSKGKKKSYHDKQGNKLPVDDADILRDVAAGHTIVSYNETLPNPTNYKTFKDRKGNTIVPVI